MHMIDRVRDEIERNALRARNGIRMVTGLHRTDVGLSPKDIVWERGRTQLWHYHSDRVRFGPPLLIIYSLFNRSYILDLRPGNSAIEQLISAGFDVYMLDWGTPDERDASNTIADYVDAYLPAAIDRVRELASVDRINLVGYCFGGLLTVLHAAHHPYSPLRSLTVLATPADFSQVGLLTDLLGRFDIDGALGPDGTVPASVIAQGFRSLAPVSEVTARIDLLSQLWDDDFVTAYQAMMGWGSSHIPLPAGVAHDLQRMTRTNALMTDQIVIGGDRLRLRDIRVPFLHVVALRDHIIPLASAAPLIDLVGSSEKEEMRLNAGHVGLMVGRSAAKNTVPKVIEFLKMRSEDVA